MHQNLTCIFNWILIIDIKDFRTNFSCLSTHPFVQSWAGVSFLQSSLCGAVFYISDSNTWIMAKQCFIQHQGLPFLSEYTVGFVGVWEGTQPARWPKLTRGTPCHIMPCSAIKREKRGFRKVTHRLPGYWQCISLLMGGSGFSLSLGLFSFSLLHLLNILLPQPTSFLAFIIPLPRSHWKWEGTYEG